MRAIGAYRRLVLLAPPRGLPRRRLAEILGDLTATDATGTTVPHHGPAGLSRR